jgi:hypothetical protein
LAPSAGEQQAPDRVQRSGDSRTASLTDLDFSDNAYGQLRARLAEYGPDARADFASPEILEFLDRTAENNGGILPKGILADDEPGLTSSAEPEIQKVVVIGKRLDPQAQEDWYKYQMRASMPGFGRAAPVASPTQSAAKSSKKPAPPAIPHTLAIKLPTQKPVSTITDSRYENAAKRLKVEVAAIKAVAEVETKGSGFLADGRPTILFERHYFRRFTSGAFDESNPVVSNKDAGGYGAGGDNQYAKLDQAYALNQDAALKSASWGRFQIMGANYSQAGYSSVSEFVSSQLESADNHLDAFTTFIEKDKGLLNALRDKDWTKFARGYNGKDYWKNDYDSKMKAAYEKFSK